MQHHKQMVRFRDSLRYLRCSNQFVPTVKHHLISERTASGCQKMVNTVMKSTDIFLVKKWQSELCHRNQSVIFAKRTGQQPSVAGDAPIRHLRVWATSATSRLSDEPSYARNAAFSQHYKLSSCSTNFGITESPCNLRGYQHLFIQTRHNKQACPR